MGPSLDQPQHPKLCCGLLGLLWAQICALAASLPGSIQDYASPGPAVVSTSFDFVTKSDGMALARQGDRQAPLVKLFRCFSGKSELHWSVGRR